MRVLVDEHLPVDPALELAGHDVDTVVGRGWAGIKNGDLLRRMSGDSCHHAQCYTRTMGQERSLDVYKIVLYRQGDGSWVAEVPAIAGCYALMPTREEALAELSHVFNMIAEEFLERGTQLPEDTTEIVNA